MAGGSSVSVVVYDSRITAMGAPGGDVYRYAASKGSTAAAYAKELAPVRTGRLRASVRREAPRTHRNGTSVRISARAKHAIYVIKGTGPIIPVSETRRGFFWIPKSRGTGYRVRYYADIRGQKANNFLEEALGLAMRSPYSRGARLYGNPFG